MPLTKDPDRGCDVWHPVPGELIYMPALDRFFLALDPIEPREEMFGAPLWAVLICSVSPPGGTTVVVGRIRSGQLSWSAKLVGRPSCR